MCQFKHILLESHDLIKLASIAIGDLLDKYHHDLMKQNKSVETFAIVPFEMLLENAQLDITESKCFLNKMTAATPSA